MSASPASSSQPHKDSGHGSSSSKGICRNFASDNVTPACPEIMQALMRANHETMASYGADAITAQLNDRFGRVFDTDLHVFPIATGTAANAVALSAMVKPYGSILCDQNAHINTDEGGAPEFLTNGAKIMTLPSADGRISPALLPAQLAHNRDKGVLAPPIQVLSLTQATEWGTVYERQHLAELNALARQHDLLIHMDGARLGNAVAHLNCTPAETTWQAGVDVLSFGGTKAGALAAEAIIVFASERTHPLLSALPHLLKRSGHLWSKQRFLSVQLLTLLENDLWLANSNHANMMALSLAEGIKQHKAARILFDVQGNEVFAVLPATLLDRLEAAGYQFYRQMTPEGHEGILARFVTSFYTQAEDIRAFLEDIHAL